MVKELQARAGLKAPAIRKALRGLHDRDDVDSGRGRPTTYSIRKGWPGLDSGVERNLQEG